MKALFRKPASSAILATAISSVVAASPAPGMQVESGRAAPVVTDPQHDVGGPEGVTLSMVSVSVQARHTVANIETLFKAARARCIPVFLSSQFYYPHEHSRHFEGGLEVLMYRMSTFDCRNPLGIEAIAVFGADGLDRRKPQIEDGTTTVTRLHKLALTGMSAHLRTEPHLHGRLGQGFEVAAMQGE